jgi:hypothetical protein
LTDDRSRRAIGAAERFADGLATDKELAEAHAGAFASALANPPQPASQRSWRSSCIPWVYFQAVCQLTGHFRGNGPRGEDIFTGVRTVAGFAAVGIPGETKCQVDLLRCVAANPFRPPRAVDQNSLIWQDKTAVKLAGIIYDDRRLPEGALDTPRLTLLADALEAAGWNDAGVLDHLRGSGSHVRGCWALDLVLGKS